MHTKFKVSRFRVIIHFSESSCVHTKFKVSRSKDLPRVILASHAHGNLVGLKPYILGVGCVYYEEGFI